MVLGERMGPGQAQVFRTLEHVSRRSCCALNRGWLPPETTWVFFMLELAADL